jgi:hypothetical protein
VEDGYVSSGVEDRRAWRVGRDRVCGGGVVGFGGELGQQRCAVVLWFGAEDVHGDQLAGCGGFYMHGCGYGQRLAQGHAHQPGHSIDERLARCGDVHADVHLVHLGGLPPHSDRVPTTTLNAISSGSSMLIGLTGIRCLLAVPSLGCGTVASGTVSTVGITVTGSLTGTFNNSTQKLVVFSNGSNQPLTATATASCDAITGFAGGGSALATFGSTSAGTGDITYSVTGSPSIWTS